jgi:hypothetical protein
MQGGGLHRVQTSGLLAAQMYPLTAFVKVSSYHGSNTAKQSIAPENCVNLDPEADPNHALTRTRPPSLLRPVTVVQRKQISMDFRPLQPPWDPLIDPSEACLSHTGLQLRHHSCQWKAHHSTLPRTKQTPSTRTGSVHQPLGYTNHSSLGSATPCRNPRSYQDLQTTACSPTPSLPACKASSASQK